MFFPEALFLLSSRDQQVTWLDPVFFREETSQALASLTIDYQVPEGRSLILQTAVADGGAGAAQNVLDLQVLARPPDANVQTYIAAHWYGGTLTGRMVNWSGSILIPARWRVSANANYSAAANPNFLHLSLIGLLIPIGNIQRV